MTTTTSMKQIKKNPQRRRQVMPSFSHKVGIFRRQGKRCCEGISWVMAVQHLCTVPTRYQKSVNENYRSFSSSLYSKTKRQITEAYISEIISRQKGIYLPILTILHSFFEPWKHTATVFLPSNTSLHTFNHDKLHTNINSSKLQETLRYFPCFRKDV